MNNITDIVNARLQWELGGIIYDLIFGIPVILIILLFAGWFDRK